MADTLDQVELFDEEKEEGQTETQADEAQAEDEALSAADIVEAAESFDKPKEEPRAETDGEAEAPEHKGDSSVIKTLRKQNREQDKALRELRRKLNEQATPKEPELGPKPTLEKCDYDSERFERETEAYLIKKRDIDAKLASKKAEEEQTVKKYQDKLASYGSIKATLGIEDYDEAEAAVLDLLDQAQQSIIVQGAKNPAVLVYALGKNEETLKKLAAIKEPVEYAFEVARLEARLEVQMKEAKKRPATQPESRVTGGSAGTATLERLRAEAEKTHDYTKVNEYKSKMRARS
jgi:hypothetical protein